MVGQGTSYSAKPMRVNVWGPLPQRTPGIRHILLGLVLTFALSSLLLFIAASMQDKSLSIEEQQKQLTAMFTQGPWAIGALVALWASLLSATFIAGRLADGGWRQMVGWYINWKRDLIIGVSTGVGMQLLSVGVGLYIQSLGVDGKQLGNTNIVTDMSSTWMPLMIVAATFGAPIIEEIFFRGLFVSVIHARWGTFASVLLSAIGFGLMHAQGSPVTMIYTVLSTGVLGAILAVVRLLTGRLGTTIVTHIVFNSLGVCLALLIH